jgi:processive 1,2-diacylglycerol beta-glucosyltransferase
MKKILITYAKYGSGHESIAKYICDYLITHNKKYEVMLLDMTPYANIPGKFGISVMKFVGKYRPEKIFNFCYNITDNKISSNMSKKYAKKSFDNKRLRNTIKSFNPDITISSHFYCSNIISYYNEIGIISSKIVTIITDYHSHDVWTCNHKKEDAFIVSNDIVKKELIKRGVNKNKIYPFGIPLSKREEENNLEVILNKYKVNNGKKNILFFGGSSVGSLYYYDYLKIFLKLNKDFNVIFISGNNKRLKNKVETLVKKEHYKNVHVLGYTKDVFNLLKISNLVITKPGGATVTECLEFNTPMLLVPGVGGQEKYNARFVTIKRYGIYAKNKRKFKKYSISIINNPKLLDFYKKNLKTQCKNECLKKINSLIKRM